MNTVFNPWNEAKKKRLRDFLENSLSPGFVDEDPLVFTKKFFEDNGYSLRESLLQLSEYSEQDRKNVDTDKMVLKSMMY